MKEVSCRTLDIFFRHLKRKGLPDEVLAEGTGYTAQNLRSKDNWIEWTAFVRLMANVGKIWSDDELIAIGRSLWTQPYLRAFSVIPRLLFTGTEFYRWVFGAKGAGDQTWRCIENGYQEISPDHLILELNLKEGYPLAREFFVLSKGNFEGMPRLLGLPLAKVDMQMTSRGARYMVQVPRGGGVLGRMKKAMLFPFTARAAAEELKAANESLGQKYVELEQAQHILAAQAQQLQTINEMGRELAQHTDLSSLSDSVTHLLTDRFSSAGVVLSIIKGQDGNAEILQRVGNTSGPPTRSFALSAGGQPLGTIDVWGYKEPEGGQELFQGLIPFISIALDNARAFALLREYQSTLEQKVAERTAALKKSTEQLEASLNRVTELDHQKTEFFANASHELRTPLTLMLAPLEMVAGQQGLPSGVVDEIRGVLRGGYRLMKLINDLLDISKLEAGAMRLRMGTTDLARLLEEVIRPWRPVVQRRRITLDAQVPPSLPLTADAERLEQVALNLLSNAVKHTPDGGTIQVRATDLQGEYEFSIENTGEGIDPEDLPRIFDRFAQSPRSRSRRFGSSGLGLPMVKELVELHGGRIEIDNAPGERVAFRVRLPVGHVSDEQPVEVPRPGATELLQYEVMGEREDAPAVAQESSEDKPVLLVAEDNGDLRSFIVRSLRSEFAIIEAADGKEAFALAQKHLPDIILSDLMMPEMDGAQLARAIKEERTTATIPIILLTARGDIDTKLTSLSRGADDYLVKPFHVAEVRQRLWVQLRMRSLSRQMAHREKLAALGTVVAGVAHEIRNPLNGIINSLLPLREMLVNTPAEVDELLQLAIAGAQRVEQVSTQLLRQVRADERPHEIGLKENISLAMQLLAHKVAAGPKVVSSFPPGEDFRIHAEPAALNQVWINLLDNAIEAAGPAGEVRIGVQRNERGVEVEVADTGPGIPPNVLKRIFDPFFTTKDVGKGMGLGLSIVREIVERHGGEVVVHSSPGQGARFKVTLPASYPQRGTAHVHG